MVEVDGAKVMGMHIKVKQLYANMGEHVVIIFRPFLDFMNSFKFSKANIDACNDVGSPLQGLEPSM
jgi:hypothetical protein